MYIDSYHVKYDWITNAYECSTHYLQASEKALKSVIYSQDANNVPKGSNSHNLMTLTSQPDLKTQVIVHCAIIW